MFEGNSDEDLERSAIKDDKEDLLGSDAMLRKMSKFSF